MTLETQIYLESLLKIAATAGLLLFLYFLLFGVRYINGLRKLLNEVDGTNKDWRQK